MIWIKLVIWFLEELYRRVNSILIYLMNNYFNNIIWLGWFGGSKDNLDDSYLKKLEQTNIIQWIIFYNILTFL